MVNVDEVEEGGGGGVLVEGGSDHLGVEQEAEDARQLMAHAQVQVRGLEGGEDDREQRRRQWKQAAGREWRRWSTGRRRRPPRPPPAGALSMYVLADERGVVHEQVGDHVRAR